MTEMTEREIDDVLADSFPASDPPSWTLGVASVDAPAESRETDDGSVAPPSSRALRR